ncbi:hypothetical protein [Actinoallomurus sp. NPDC050550]|uniref:hypothetical protein n=1 Tax=Actinoallomurus sp. NPDC050550 TaxID=3154937 RepID=UPI003401809D
MALAQAARHGFHWWFGRRRPDVTRDCQVAVSETGARRALTIAERAEEERAIRATVGRMVDETPRLARRRR